MILKEIFELREVKNYLIYEDITRRKLSHKSTAADFDSKSSQIC